MNGNEAELFKEKLYASERNNLNNGVNNKYHTKSKKEGKSCNFIFDILIRPAFAFFKMYILKKGFLEGWLGFVLCLNYANYTLNKYVKLRLLR